MAIEDRLYGYLGAYGRAPQWVRTLIGGLYACLPKSVRLGRAFGEFETNFLNLQGQGLTQYARARLAETLRVAITQVPAYAGYQHLLGTVDTGPLGVLGQMPLLDKEQIKQQPARYLASGARPGRGLEMFTGGSTAVPLRFYLEKGLTRPREWAAFSVLSGRYNLDGPGVVLALRGRSVPLARIQAGQVAYFEPIKKYLVASSDHLEPAYMPLYEAALARWRPKYIHAFPSALYPLVLWLAARERLDLLGDVRGVLLTSESVLPYQLDAFQKYFSCPVVVQYGHSERVLFAHTLPGDPRYFFWPHYGHFELLDSAGQPVTRAGEVGEIVGTSFDNRVMPFVRYRTGDFAVLSAGENSLFPGFPVCERIEGRLQEFVVCRDGRLVSVTTLGAAHFDELDACLRIQYEQQVAGELLMRVLPLDTLSETACRNIERAIAEKLQGTCQVRLQLVDSIALTGRGKQRLLLQHLDVSRFLGAAMMTLGHGEVHISDGELNP